ncbi:ABC transporter substrate-binding protein [Lentisphaera profundi]|uniref:ABC transporter substrate-binding protein n=1 Tax=Lentisphaera profundi TaxID=1658616 RepID=A0ABY7VN57_9BACT|nr:ABC transporter substrate-binding protein [Lentisphaera profundi]WDE95525.1 ABC transporter substrate-binding protein [Lentisphaera profundi]
MGTSGDYYPIIFKKDGQFQGVEADLAEALSIELGRPIKFIEMPFSSLIPALNGRQIDIIMAGMSITDERKNFVKFAEPYMEISQMMLIRTRDMGRFRKPGNNYYVNSGMKMGVISDTTGETLAQKHLKKQNIKSYDNIDQAVVALKRKQIDCFIHDAPYIWSYTNTKVDKELTGVYWDLSKEKLAWGLGLTNFSLQQDIEKVLLKWKLNGFKAKIIQKWVPYRVNYSN